MKPLTIKAPIRAYPQGSKRALLPKQRKDQPIRAEDIRMVEMSKGVKAYRKALAQIARNEATRQGWQTVPIHQPVCVWVRFWMQRPLGHYVGRKRAGLLRLDAPTLLHAQQPDIDKLERATFDALTTAGIWADDSQAAAVDSAKCWADTDGVEIRLSLPGTTNERTEG